MRRLLLPLFLTACTPSDATATYDVAWSELDRVYALFEVKDIDWDALGDQHRPAVGADDAALFGALTGLLGPLDDNHVQLLTPDREPWTPGGLQGAARDSFHADVVAEILDEVDDPHPMVRTGSVAGLGYLWLGVEDGVPVDIARTWLAQAPQTGLILDLRGNFGGYAMHAEAMASCFVDAERVYARARRRTGPQHDDVTDWIESRVPSAHCYDGPVVVLTDSFTISGGELLLLALGDDAVRIGVTTAGAFGARVWRDLPNGWVVSATVEDLRTLDGHSLEAVGIQPDIPVVTTLQDLQAGEDPILAAGVDELLGR